MEQDARTHELDARILALIAAGDATGFDGLALDLFAFQYERNDVYRALCDDLGAPPGRVCDPSDIPAVWPVAWRLADLRCFPAARIVRTFHSSGTTGGGRSRHAFDTLDLYRAALAGPFAEALMPAGATRAPILVLMPSPEQAPDGSLSFMMGEVVERFGQAGASGFFVHDGELLADDFAAAVSDLDGPAVLASTALGWVRLLEAIGPRTLPLPPGSRIMETGGHKGRHAAWDRDELYLRLADAFAVTPEAVVSEYGMCELSSQFYARSRFEVRSSKSEKSATPDLPLGLRTSNFELRTPVFSGPPWTRVAAIDPETRRPVPAGEPGLLKFIDLANRGSAIAVQTEDLGVVRGDRAFALIGRAPAAPPKGCSLSADDLLKSGPGPLLPAEAVTPPAEGDVADPEIIARIAGDLRSRAAPADSADAMLARVGPLAEVTRRWLDDADPIRREALDHLPDRSPFSRAMWADALELMFAPVTAEALRALVRDEAGERPTPFPLIGQVLAGNVPAPAVQAIFAACLAGASQIVKPASEDPLFPELLARSIAAASPELGGRIAVVRWPGASQRHNTALASAVDAVVAFGRGESITNWRSLCEQAGRPLIVHGPRTSVEIIELEKNGPSPLLASAVARDAAMYDQQGCLSPQQVYVAGSADACVHFATDLAAALTELASRWPLSRRRDPGQLLTIRQLREAQRIRRLASDEAARPWLLAGGRDRFDWTLVGTVGASPQIGPGGRTLFLTRVASADAALRAIAPLAPHIQGVALSVADASIRRRLADELHIPYICAPGDLQRPPFGWLNDNIAALGSLMG
ncbi:MAG: hypothetical protein BIFFINMI_03762 [Phycisphaerae bacterium]|nr:hypothetical protein [Phycisphaerae bacterium]